MQIPGAVERNQFNLPPVVTSLQRKRYLDFFAGVLTLARRLCGTTNRIHFLTGFGRFNTTYRFYLPDQVHPLSTHA